VGANVRKVSAVVWIERFMYLRFVVDILSREGDQDVHDVRNRKVGTGVRMDWRSFSQGDPESECSVSCVAAPVVDVSCRNAGKCPVAEVNERVSVEGRVMDAVPLVKLSSGAGGKLGVKEVVT
jgi:hypothetical protein